MAGITDTNRLWRRRQRQFIVRTGITEDLTTVSTVMLNNGEKGEVFVKKKKIKIAVEIYLVIGYQ